MNISTTIPAMTSAQTQSFAAMCAGLNRSPMVIRDLQKRFELPVLSGAAYSPAYSELLRSIIYLRIFGISFQRLTRLWQIECSLMRLLNADSTGSPTWFLDACGAINHKDQRLLLSNFDIGATLQASAVQPGLNFQEESNELFSSLEMGQDVLSVLDLYREQHKEIMTALQAELPMVRSALNLARKNIF